MIDRDDIEQRPHQIIDIADWPIHGDYEVFPVGARDKSLRVCPTPAPYSFCLPGHKYLFKEAIKSVRDPNQPRHPDQYWAEVIAFRIGRLMGIPVPPAFVAYNSITGEPGTIIEWFIGYNRGISERYSAGGDHMQAMIEGYDRKKGREHNLEAIVKLCRSLSIKGQLSHSWREYWGLCLGFDAVIGNTDRHQENWGLIWDDEERGVRLSPYFDNGTSLGHELNSHKMAHYMKDRRALDAYINRGKHHMKWRASDGERLGLSDGVARYCQTYPQLIPLLRAGLQWDDESFDVILGLLTEFNIQSPLLPERAKFIAKLTARRKQLLLNLLEGLENEVH